MDVHRLELSQPRYETVNVYRIGNTLIDTGHVHDASRRQLRESLSGGALAGVDRIVLTHPHIDHVGGYLTEPTATRLPIVVYDGADDVLENYEDYLRDARREMATFASPPDVADPRADDLYFPLDGDYATDEVAIERVVQHGESIEIDGVEWTVVHTPGHSQQHMALSHDDSGTVLSGDVVSTNGYFMYGPIHWDLDAYEAGLRRIRDREPDRLLPGHGDPLTDPRARIDDALAKTAAVESAVLEAVADRGPLDARQLARETFGASDDAVDFLATVASAYAIHLAERGLIDVERRPQVVAKPV